MIKMGKIKTRITCVVAASLIVLMLICELISSSSLRKNLSKDATDYVQMEAETKAQVLDDWLNKQAGTVEQLADAIAYMNAQSLGEKQVYLGKELEKNKDALMYYICYENKDKAYMAGGQTLDIVVTERDWWKQAVEKQALIFTQPYQDVATKKTVVSIAYPYTEDGVQCVLLADFDLTVLVKMVNNIDANKDIEGFLLGQDGSVIAHNNKAFLPKGDKNTNLAKALNVDLKSKNLSQIKDYDGVKKYIGISKISATGWELGILKNKNADTKKVLLNSYNMVIGCALLVIVSILVTGYAIRKNLKPMENMKQFVIERIIGKERKIEAKTESQEIQLLLEELEKHFIATIRQAKDITGIVDQQMEETSGRMKSINGNITGINSMIHSTNQNIDSQSNAIEDINRTCTQVADAVESVAGQAQNIAERASSIIERVSDSVSAVIEDKKMAVSITSDSKQKLQDAITRVQVIEQITTVSSAIREIASQTRLLSLNASIEAARAGEAGKGFAVVAEEIRGLSDVTNEEVDKVDQLIHSILESVTVLKDESMSVIDFLDSKVLEDYDKLETVANNYLEDAKYYEEVSTDLGAATEEINASAQDIVNVLESITSSQTKIQEAVIQIDESLSDIGTSSVDANGQVENVSEEIARLHETVEQFNV